MSAKRLNDLLSRHASIGLMIDPVEFLPKKAQDTSHIFGYIRVFQSDGKDSLRPISSGFEFDCLYLLIATLVGEFNYRARTILFDWINEYVEHIRPILTWECFRDLFLRVDASRQLVFFKRMIRRQDKQKNVK